MMAFEYLEPTTLGECVQMLEHHGPAGCLLAGGTDVVVRLRERTLRPHAVISLARLPELASLERTRAGDVVLGAMTTLREVERAGWLDEGLALVRQAASAVGCVQVRNVATLGGNTCNASPSADTVPALIAAGAEVRVVGPAGERRLPLEGFVLGPGQVALGRGELLHGFRLPPAPPRTGAIYLKHAIRGSVDLAIVGIAARVTLDEAGRISTAAIVMGAVGATAIRAQRAEGFLAGAEPTDAVIREAARAAAGESSPISDQRASAEYRRRMIVVSAREALHAAVRAARGAGGRTAAA